MPKASTFRGLPTLPSVILVENRDPVAYECGSGSLCFETSELISG